MKKLVLATLAIAVMAGSAFAQGAEMKVKVGLDSGVSDFESSGTHGVCASAEFVFPVDSMVKIGPGVGISFIQVYNSNSTINFVPIYGTIEISPIKSAPGVFFKGNIGFSVGDVSGSFESGSYGGIYYGLGAGYEFPFGLFFDALYSWTTMNGTSSWSGNFTTFKKFTISAGYKFAI